MATGKTVPSSEPKKTLPESTNGEDSLRLGSARDQMMWPLRASSAATRPSSAAPARERIVAYTVFPTTAGAAAERTPSCWLQRVLPVYLSTALSTPSSVSWKMRFSESTGGNSRSEVPPRAHITLYGGRRLAGAGQER